jgi:hypothetical protein
MHVRLDNWTASAAPTVNDDSGDGYEVGSQWLNTNTGSVYTCTYAGIGAATWSSGGGASTLNDLTDVDTTGQTTGSLLRYNGSSWVVYADSNYAASGHNHSGVYEPVISAGTTGQYWRGDKTWQTLTTHDAVTIGASASDVLSLSTQALGAVDAGADKLLFWDESENKTTYLTLGTNLSISGTTINATGGGTPGGSDTQVQFNDGGAFGGASAITYNKTTSVTTFGGVVLTTAGSVTAPAIAASTDTNTGLYWSAADELSIATGGTQRIAITSTGNLDLIYSGSTKSTFAVSSGGYLNISSSGGYIMTSSCLALTKPSTPEWDALRFDRTGNTNMFKFTISVYDEQYLYLKGGDGNTIMQFGRASQTVTVPGALIASGTFGANKLGIARAYDGLALSRFTETDGYGERYELQTLKDGDSVFGAVASWGRPRQYFNIHTSVGINLQPYMTAGKALEVNSATGDCLRLTYNNDDGDYGGVPPYYCNFTVSNAGDLTITPSGGNLTVATADVDIASDKAFYLGSPGTDGTWRINRSGNNLILERRESGSYVTKQTITA